MDSNDIHSHEAIHASLCISIHRFKRDLAAVDAKNTRPIFVFVTVCTPDVRRANPVPKR
jgi:hypothetical protein